MPRLKFTSFDGVTHTHELPPGTTRIGRTPDNDLQIDELEVSSHQCELRYEGESIVVRDLDSFGGTYVDGQPVAEAEVKIGQIISLGSFLLTLEASSAAAPRPQEPELKPVRLHDGSYSCLRHHTKRALYECESCFDLACEECVRTMEEKDGSRAALCQHCGIAMRSLDWSKLEAGKKELLTDLFVPKQVKQAVEFWERHKNKLSS